MITPQHRNAIIRLEDTRHNMKKRVKMPLNQRAKQFLPFAAVKGHTEALRKMEEKVEKEMNKENEKFME